MVRYTFTVRLFHSQQPAGFIPALTGGSPMLPNASIPACRSVDPGGSPALPNLVSRTAGFPGRITGRLPQTRVNEAPDGFLFSTACGFASRPPSAVGQIAYPERISSPETISCYVAD